MNNTLVIYYSYTGNSKKIAQEVSQKCNADLLELEPKIPFSTDYNTVVEEWQNNDIKRDIEIKDIDVDLSKYQKIVLITCTWWYGISPVMKRFLKENDLSNKDIIVAATNAGWIGHCFRDYKELLPNANIKGELDIVFSPEEEKRDMLMTPEQKINQWIEKLNN